MNANIKRFADNLKRQAQENPLLAVAIGAGAVTAVTKLIEANTQRTYAKAHVREIDRRVRAQSYK